MAKQRELTAIILINNKQQLAKYRSRLNAYKSFTSSAASKFDGSSVEKDLNAADEPTVNGCLPMSVVIHNIHNRTPSGALTPHVA